MIDLLLRNARLARTTELTSIGIDNGLLVDATDDTEASETRDRRPG